MIPYPDPALVTLLSALPSVATGAGGRVSTALDSVLPALRVTKVSDLEAPTREEATPIYQIEVWAADEFQAGQIAWAIANEWPTAKRQVVGDALVHGRWVDSNPTSSPDPETDFPRYLVTVGIRLSGVSA